jgi:hypothetical protein
MRRSRRRDEDYGFDLNGLIENNTIEVENISEDTTTKDLHRLFSKHGSVLSVAIEADYKSTLFGDRNSESDEEIEFDDSPESSEAPKSNKVVGRVKMLISDAPIAAKNLHGRRWRGQQLRLTFQRRAW